MAKFLSNIIIVFGLTALTQLGGLAWLIALFFKRRLFAFAVCYATLSVSALWVAPMFGREPLACIGGNSLRMQSKFFCLLNRHYVVPELKETLADFASKIEDDYPGTTTRILDANFPFITGFPLLPHLSHDDGRKVDIAFYYRDEKGYLPNATRSPIGYFAFEDGPTNCPDQLLSLRWNMTWLQDIWPDYQPDQQRMVAALEWLSADPRVAKIFIEPHLRDEMGVQSSKIRFQGCRAARHDDHIHIQL